jgi:hypothetical protein
MVFPRETLQRGLWGSGPGLEVASQQMANQTSYSFDLADKDRLLDRKWQNANVFAISGGLAVTDTIFL